MIAVVADDLTGAAELGGIGLRYNLAVEVQTAFNPDTQADLLIINTDSRSQTAAAATAATATVMEKLAALQPEFIYKKIDSVLRGHVLPELKAQLRALHLDKALVVPANPALGRTISQGTYFLNNVPIHESSFAQDPEFPIHSARVLHMVKPNGIPVTVQPHQAPWPGRGIVIGEASTSADVSAWAQTIVPGTALAGGAEFFTALLQSHGQQLTRTAAPAPVERELPMLLVSGTTFGKSRDLIKQVKNNNGPVSYMPAEIMLAPEPSSEHYNQWATAIARFMYDKGTAILAIDPASTPAATLSASELRKKTAGVMPYVFKQIRPKEMFLEGGSTASAILEQLGYHRFIPVNELAPGVTRMRVAAEPDLHLTLKPGSYNWPASVWNF